MFDTMQIARRIRQARIEKNMTQLDLADAMGVSFQAVSNWERGNSMPDIGKLEDLCHILELEVSELLGMESKAADAVDKVLEKEDLTLEELAEVAPMLPPKQIREHAEKAKGKKKVNFSQIVSLAPFLDEEYLSSLVADADVEDLSEVVSIAPFLSQAALDGIVSRCESSGDLWAVIGLAPFLRGEKVDSLALNAEVDDVSQLASLAPFMSRGALEKLVERCEVSCDGCTLCGLAPFVERETLSRLVDRLLEKGEALDCISGLAPFLDQATLRKIADKLMEDNDLEGLSGVVPFL